MSSQPTVTFTIIRHGESTDNLHSIWAGWKDSPLSNHGMNQAKAVGLALRPIRFIAILASSLKRTHMTAQAIKDLQQEPQPIITSSPLLREQHFGVAEGKPWMLEMEPGLTPEQHFAQGLWPVLPNRKDKFPEGESVEDLAQRAKQAVDQLLMPYVWQAARGGERGIHVAVVSHGLCISELVPALLSKDASRALTEFKYRGLLNTAWTRVTVDVKGVKEGESMHFDDDFPPLTVRVTDFNRHDHLDNVTRQKGGIGSAAYDPKQQSIRTFFGGATVEKEEGRAQSNARDEANI